MSKGKKEGNHHEKYDKDSAEEPFLRKDKMDLLGVRRTGCLPNDSSWRA